MILVTDPTVLDKIAAIEKGGWRYTQERAATMPEEKPYSLPAAIERWTKSRGTSTIYGDGGWNRWFVRSDGRVVFSRHHGHEGDAELALAAGFDVE